MSSWDLHTGDVQRFWSKVDRSGANECWPWKAGVDKDGYGKFQVGPAGRQVHLRAHRVAALLAGIAIDGLVVMHSCDNPPCCNGTHLSSGTTTDNRADCTAKDRNAKGARNGRNTMPESTARGSAHGMSRIDEDQARAIRHRLDVGERQAHIARSLGVSLAIVNAIANGRTWRHVR